MDDWRKRGKGIRYFDQNTNLELYGLVDDIWRSTLNDELFIVDYKTTTVKRGINYLISNQLSNSQWYDESFTAPGFPRVFYLKYHGYSKYFPLWALARYRNLSQKIN